MNCSMSSYSQTGQSAELNKENIKASLAEIEKKERKLAYNRAYYQANKDSVKATNTLYRKLHPKSHRISVWRARDVKLRPDENWGDVYKAYIMTIKCQSCEVEFNPTVHNTQRCLDHDHNEPNYIRGTICKACNYRDSWKTRMTPDSIYQKYKSTTT